MATPTHPYSLRYRDLNRPLEVNHQQHYLNTNRGQALPEPLRGNPWLVPYIYPWVGLESPGTARVYGWQTVAEARGKSCASTLRSGLVNFFLVQTTALISLSCISVVSGAKRQWFLSPRPPGRVRTLGGQGTPFALTDASASLRNPSCPASMVVRRASAAPATCVWCSRYT